MILKKRLVQLGIAVGLALLLVGAVLAYMDRVVLMGYTIDLVEVSEQGNLSMWVYAVTAGDQVPENDLSHWSLGIGSCYTLVTPTDGSIYTTPIDGYECGSTYTCTQGTYLVVYDAGMGGTSAVTDGIKFETQTGYLGLDNQRTQIFTFTIEKAADQELRIGDAYLDVKPGNTLYQDTVMGAVCAPNSVTITAIEAHGQATYWAIAGLVGTIVLGASWRRRFRTGS
jgi:hypothetical protein